MWTKFYKKEYSGVKKERIWALWIDVNSWPKWHGDLEYCKLEGDFVVGNHFVLKPKGSPAVKISLTKISSGREFTDCTHFFGAKMYDTHAIEETENGVLLSNKLVVTGPLKWLWIWLVARKVADSVPEEIDALVSLARKI